MAYKIGLKIFLICILNFSSTAFGLPSERNAERVLTSDSPLFLLRNFEDVSLEGARKELERIKSNKPLLETVLGQRESKLHPALESAVLISREDLVKFFIDQGSVIEDQYVKQAVLQEDIEIFKMLLDQKIKTDPTINTKALFWIQYEKPSAVPFLQECFRFEVDSSARIKGKISPIHLASGQMNVSAVGMLASNGFDINVQDANLNTAGHWMLFYAKKNSDSVLKENREGVIWGLRALNVMGLDWQIRNKKDRNVLEESFTMDGLYEVSRSLIERDEVDLNDKNSQDENALFSAIRNRRYKEALLMLDRKVNVNSINRSDKPVIWLVASTQEMNEELAADLNRLAFGLIESTFIHNLKVTDKKRQNVLYYFIKNNFSIPVIEQVVKRIGADFKDASGRDPMSYISGAVRDWMDVSGSRCQRQLGVLGMQRN